MTDKQIKQMQKRIEELELTLRVIHTWTACDHLDPHPRHEAMKHIQNKCREALKMEEIK